MAEKDATARLRRAVKENNLFLVKRLIQKTDMRNIDPSTRRYTSLAWAAVLGHEETFEFLLTSGHDDTELSKDSENNTILMLLADHRPPSNVYAAHEAEDSSGATVRMARLYYDRYPDVLDWANAQGRTALHIAAIKGNEELVRMFCDLEADINLSDNKGDTPLHYASAWGHIPVVQLLIERGCQFNLKNNEGFTASDYAYSFSTKDTLQDTARITVENNKKSRKNLLHAQAAADRAHDCNGTFPIPMPLPNLPSRHRNVMRRMRSSSGTSRSTTTASDCGDLDNSGLAPGLSQSPFSASSSSSQPSTGSNSYYHPQHLTPQIPAMNSTLTVSGSSSTNPGSSFTPPANTLSSLSPVATRVRERDADAIERYLLRNRSGSQGTSSPDNRSQNGSSFASAGPSANGDNITALNPVSNGGTSTPRRLRPSVSAAQLRTAHAPIHTIHTQPESRHRAGTGSSHRSVSSSLLTRSQSTSTSPRSMTPGIEESESYMGPPSQYAQFPEPPLPSEEASTPVAQRRRAFHILPKPLPPVDPSVNHRRGMSANAVRGA
ncbi:hypothetical protein H2248_006478 [Termitomyces sp. 'cryptogamus']|nr:hypothetical protein H2248_006478 [Termitomyces sp. 'cryptogamus']